jgi:hypothetical protein
MPEEAVSDESATDDAATETPEELGESGQKALDAFKNRARQAERESKNAARQLKQASAELEMLKQAGASDSEKAIAAATKEAAAKARTEALSEANSRLIRAEVRTAAVSEKIDPALAVKLLDLDDFEVDDNGEVDTKSIAKAIKGLIEEHPYLTGEKDGRPRGTADGGARRTAVSDDDMNLALRRAAGRA